MMSEFPKALNFKLILDEIRYSYIKKKECNPADTGRKNGIVWKFMTSKSCMRDKVKLRRNYILRD